MPSRHRPRRPLLSPWVARATAALALNSLQVSQEISDGELSKQSLVVEQEASFYAH
jgi:hypothetical protein